MKSKWGANIGNFAPKIKRGGFVEPIDICFKMDEGKVLGKMADSKFLLGSADERLFPVNAVIHTSFAMGNRQIAHKPSSSQNGICLRVAGDRDMDSCSGSNKARIYLLYTHTSMNHFLRKHKE